MKRIAVKYGLWMFLGFTALFLLFRPVGLSISPSLRVFSIFIHITLICLAIRIYQRQYPDDFNYLPEVANGMYASLIGVPVLLCFKSFFWNLTPICWSPCNLSLASTSTLIPFRHTAQLTQPYSS